MTERTYRAMRDVVYAARSDADREGYPQPTCAYVGSEQYAEIRLLAPAHDLNEPGAPRLKWLGLRVFRVDDTSHFELNR